MKFAKSRQKVLASLFKGKYAFLMFLIIFSVISHSNPLSAAGRFRYLCHSKGKDYFTIQLDNPKCKMDFLAESWYNLSLSEDRIIDYNFLDIVRKGNKVKVWSRHLLSQPTTFGGGTQKYDSLKVLSEYSCGERQVYTPHIMAFLAGQYIGETSFIIEDIEPESMDDQLYKIVCNGTASGGSNEYNPQNMGRVRKISPDEIIVLDSSENPPSNNSAANTIIIKNQSNKSRLLIFLSEFLPYNLPYLVLFVGGFSLFYLQTNRIFQAIGIVMITIGFMATIGGSNYWQPYPNSSQPYPYYSGVLVSLPLVILIYFWGKYKNKE